MNKIFVKLLLFQVVAMCIAYPVWGQTADDDRDVSKELEKLRLELQDLVAQQDVKLQELERLMAEIQAKLEEEEVVDELQKLLEEATQLTVKEPEVSESVGKRFSSGVRNMQALNPEISLLGEFYGGVSTEKGDIFHEPGETMYGNNGFFIRGLEVNINSPLDPFTRGKTTISFSDDEIEIELGYMEWLNLPLKSNTRIGLIRPEFGAFNRYHAHALPQFDRPRALVNLFGIENLAGLGIASSFLLPSFIANVNTLELSVMRGASGSVFTDEGKNRLIYTVDLKNYYDLSSSTFFEWTLSGAVGKNDPGELFNSYVGDVGFTLKWMPALRSLYRSLDWKTEFLFGKRETAGEDINSLGFYSSLQNRLNRSFVLGSRIGYSELPFDSSQKEWDFTVNLDYWQSEFVYVRFQYQFTDRDILVDDVPVPDDSSLRFHVVWAMGPHKHEAY